VTDEAERQTLARIEARRRRPRRRLTEEHVTLAHGAGGSSTHALVETIFLPAIGNELLAPLADSAVVACGSDSRLAFTTDSYVVRPLRFPGGDIATLAVNGTINDLAAVGATPLCLSAALIIEEGFPIATLEQLAGSLGAAAREAGVPIATADTKVVERTKADGLYICMAGVGVVPAGLTLDPAAMHPGDRVLLSGTIAEHGMAVLVARGELELEAEIASDTAALHGLAAELLAATGGVRCMRDPTRGGLATTLNELARAAELSVVIDEAALPIRPVVTGACELLGIDPLYVANEGKLVAVVAATDSAAALAALRSHPLGRHAAIVGEVRAEPPGMVVLETAFGGTRVVDMLAGDPLPRIC
jgi:hydrogenase expression/formation protein HypE